MKLQLCSEGKEKRVCNLGVETLVSPLGPNLFMYAGSFFFGGKPFLYLLCWKGIIFIIMVLLALVKFFMYDQSYLTSIPCGTSKLSWLKRPAQYRVLCTLFPFSPYPWVVVTMHKSGSMFQFSFKLLCQFYCFCF